MKRKVQTGMLRAALVAVICAIGSVLGLRAETYYWTGAVDNALSKAGNWSLTDGGSAAGKAPGQGDTVIFNNTGALSLTKSDHVRYLRYFFNGASVSIPASGSLRHYGYGGGGITVTGTGTYTFTYPLELNASQFAGEDKTFTVDVADGASVVVNDSGTTKIYSPAHFIKRGGGTYKTTQFIETKSATAPRRGDLTFEAGVLTTERPSDRHNYFGVFTVKGTATKKFTQDAMNVHISRYVEEPEASQTMTFYNAAGDAYAVDLQDDDDVPRFSADITGQYGSNNTLNWNPTEDKTLTMVDRVWNSGYGKFLVSKGTMKFAEGAGIKKIGGFTVKAGANVTIAASASADFSGAAIVLEAGATLTIEGGDHYFRPKSVTYDGTKVADGVYSAGEPTWLKGTGHLWIGSATRPAVTLCWTGAAGEASPKLSTVANWRCEDGSPVAALQANDSRIIDTDTDFEVFDNFTIGTDCTFTKRGAGTFQCARFMPVDVASRGTFVFEEGKIASQRASASSDRVNNFGEVVVTGAATKQFSMSAMSISIVKYVEDESASQTLTFYNYEGNIDTYTVELCGAYDVPRFSANLFSSYGGYTLKWNPGAEKTITMVDRVWNSTTCKFLVSTGTMRFADGAGIKALAGLTVANGAKLAIAANAGSFGGTLNLNLETGATLVLEADKTLSALSYGGTPVPDGVYTTADLEWLDGEGRLIVGSGSPTAVPATWTGGGDQTTITDPLNWGGALPDFSSGSLVATFPANGTVTIPSGETWKFRGIVVDPFGATTDKLTIQGEGEMWVGADGLVSRGAGAVSIAVRTGIISSNPWTFGQTVGGGSLTIESTGEVFTIGDAVWTVNTALESYRASGDGPYLDLRGANPNLGDSSFKMPVRVFADGALGGADSTATIDCDAKANIALDISWCHLYNKQIVLENVSNFNYLRAFRSTGEVTIDGELLCKAPNDYFWFSSFPNAENEMLTVKGGWKTTKSTNMARISRPYADGYKIRVETAFAANKFYLDHWGWFYLNCEGDIPGGAFIGDGAYLRLDEGASFKQGTDARSVAGVGFTGTEGTGTLDLQGNDATVQILAGEGAGVVTSEEAATLTLNANTEFVTPHERGWESAPTFSTKIGGGTSAPDREVDIKDIQQTDHASFQGCANLVKTGPLPHWTSGVSTSTGTVTVAEGVLTFKDGAKWRTTPTVTVSGTGVLGIEGNRTFSGKTDLVVTGEETADRIRIAAGKKLIVKSLTVNGEPQTSVPDGLVTGGGDLQIGPDGGIVIVR